MKTGSHNLGGNAFSNITLAKLDAGSLTLSQSANGSVKKVILSANQIALLKDVLA